MTEQSVRAARTMRARKESICAWCGSLISRHQPIGLVEGEGWQHVGCILKRQQSWRIIAEPTEQEQERRHAAEQARALAFLRSTGKSVS